jgi:hypothetical protein
VLFDRSFDADMAGTSGNDVFEEDGSSVLAKEGDGLMLTSMVPSMIANLGAETFVDFVASGASTCIHSFESNPTPAGDHVGIAAHVANIGPGATVNFKVAYRLM